MNAFENARTLLDYNKESGVFTWKTSRGGLAQKGVKAGSLDTKGYVQIKIDGRLIFAHRLAWFFVNGGFDFGHIDHIDRNPQNNAIANLRPCAHFENHQNTGLRADNTSGVTGVSFLKKSGKWLAYINLKGKRISVGRFDSFGDAVEARLKAKGEIHTFNPTQDVARFSAPEYAEP
jgi:hypothetical protein